MTDTTPAEPRPKIPQVAIDRLNRLQHMMFLAQAEADEYRRRIDLKQEELNGLETSFTSATRGTTTIIINGKDGKPFRGTSRNHNRQPASLEVIAEPSIVKVDGKKVELPPGTVCAVHPQTGHFLHTRPELENLGTAILLAREQIELLKDKRYLAMNRAAPLRTAVIEAENALRERGWRGCVNLV